MRKLFFSLVALMFFISACRFGGRQVRGNGHITSQQRTVTNFEGISVAGDLDVYFTAGAAYSVKIEADENLMEYIETENDGDVLQIQTRNRYNLRSSSPIKIYVTAPTLDAVEVTGSGKFIAQSKIASSKNVKIEVTGSGDARLDVDAPEVTTQITGSGDIRVTGNTRKLDGEINGSGNIKCFDLLSEETRIEINGSGDAEVFASKQLKIDINGSGDVAYKGSPSISQNSSGSGSVRKVE
jgi:hypothetical protein